MFSSFSWEPITINNAAVHEKCSKFQIMKVDIFYIKPNLQKKKIFSKHSRKLQVFVFKKDTKVEFSTKIEFN
jgi:hypothetical protein